MSRFSSEVAAEIVPAWQDFIRDATPNRKASEAYRALLGLAKGSGYHDKARHLRDVLNGTIFPGQLWTWDAAEALHALNDPRTTWCAGPLFLFAHGDFDLFAKLIIDVPEADVSLARKRALLIAAETACIPLSIETLRYQTEQRVAQVTTRSDWDRGTKERVIRRLRQRAVEVPPRRDDREAWILGPEEYGAFEAAFARIMGSRPSRGGRLYAVGSQDDPRVSQADDRMVRLTLEEEQNAGVRAAIVARQNPLCGVLTQRQIVVSTLLASIAQALDGGIKASYLKRAVRMDAV